MGGIGFRELENFNEALLTKMDARILNEPGALWVRTIKELNFPNTDFLFGKQGCRASWGRTSLIHGRDSLFKEGIWQIEDGVYVRIFKDPWVVTKPGVRVDGSSEGEQPLDTRVHDLIWPY